MPRPDLKQAFQSLSIPQTRGVTGSSDGFIADLRTVNLGVGKTAGDDLSVLNLGERVLPKEEIIAQANTELGQFVRAIFSQEFRDSIFQEVSGMEGMGSDPAYDRLIVNATLFGVAYNALYINQSAEDASKALDHFEFAARSAKDSASISLQYSAFSEYAKRVLLGDLRRERRNMDDNDVPVKVGDYIELLTGNQPSDAQKTAINRVIDRWHKAGSDVIQPTQPIRPVHNPIAEPTATPSEPPAQPVPVPEKQILSIADVLVGMGFRFNVDKWMMLGNRAANRFDQSEPNFRSDLDNAQDALVVAIKKDPHMIAFLRDHHADDPVLKSWGELITYVFFAGMLVAEEYFDQGEIIQRGSPRAKIISRDLLENASLPAAVELVAKGLTNNPHNRFAAQYPQLTKNVCELALKYGIRFVGNL